MTENKFCKEFAWLMYKNLRPYHRFGEYWLHVMSENINVNVKPRLRPSFKYCVLDKAQQFRFCFSTPRTTSTHRLAHASLDLYFLWFILLFFLKNEWYHSLIRFSSCWSVISTDYIIWLTQIVLIFSFIIRQLAS